MKIPILKDGLNNKESLIGHVYINEKKVSKKFIADFKKGYIRLNRAIFVEQIEKDKMIGTVLSNFGAHKYPHFEHYGDLVDKKKRTKK